MKAEFRVPRAEYDRMVSPLGIRHSACNTSRSRSGQAIIEMVVGLVAILVLVAGLLQLGRLGHEHTQLMMEAREEAGQYAMSDQYALEAPEPQYLYNWSEGGDGRRHSRDDRPLYALSQDVSDEVLVHAKPGELANRVGDNLVSAAYANEAILESFRLVHGRDKSDDIPLYPVIRSLVYNADSIQLESDVWLTWARDIE